MSERDKPLPVMTAPDQHDDPAVQPFARAATAAANEPTQSPSPTRDRRGGDCLIGPALGRVVDAERLQTALADADPGRLRAGEHRRGGGVAH
jgi:hypothetical protein